MCPIVYQTSQAQPDSTASTSSFKTLVSPDNIPSIRHILSTISDDKSLAIFKVIAEQGNDGADSRTIRIKLSLTQKEYYRRLTILIQNGLIIKKDRDKKILLTSLGKVFYGDVQSIQYTLNNIWKLRAVDTIRISDNRIYEDIDKIASTLIDILIGEGQIKEILKR